jgi:hypothetical protein
MTSSELSFTLVKSWGHLSPWMSDKKTPIEHQTKAIP